MPRGDSFWWCRWRRSAKSSVRDKSRWYTDQSSTISRNGCCRMPYTIICFPQVIASKNQSQRTNHPLPIKCNLAHSSQDNCIFRASERRIVRPSSVQSRPKSQRFFLLFRKSRLKFPIARRSSQRLQNAILTLPTNEWNNCSQSWFERLQKCFNPRGEYFDKH